MKSVFYCSARCGAGKTTAALAMIGRNQGLYIYCIDRKEVAEGRAETIRASAASMGLTPPIIEIVFSDNTNDGARKPIADLIAEAVERCSGLVHAAIIITHAGLQMTTHETFPQPHLWRLLIDETPQIFEVRSVDSGPLLIPFFAAHFELQEDRSISLTRPVPAREFDRPTLQPLRQLYDIVKRGGAVASVSSWAETSEPWYVSRCWDASLLQSFDSVTIFADSFTETIPYHVLKTRGVTFEEIFLEDHRVWRQRRVTISYYTGDHEASGTLFARPDARIELAKVAEHMSRLRINNHLWTTNASIAPVFDRFDIPGDRVTPKQAGSNRWVEWHDASMIYSARPSPDEIIIHAEHGMTEEDLIRARGGYDIKQFVLRLSLRDPDSTAPVTVRVYDAEQAKALAEYLDSAYGMQCDIEPVDAGIRIERRKPGRPATITPEERSIRKSIANAKAYAKRKAREDRKDRKAA